MLGTGLTRVRMFPDRTRTHPSADERVSTSGYRIANYNERSQ